MADQRLKEVYDAASFLFIKKGYLNTQVSEVANRAGIATGTIYNLFSGKKALLHFVILATFDKDYMNGDISLPIKEVEDELIIKKLCEILDQLFSQIERKTEDGEPAQSFIDLLSVIFDYAANYQVAFNLINDNWNVLQKIEERYRQYVNRLYDLLEKKLEYYIKQGEVREIEEPGLHLRNIFEGITWWSMYIPYQHPEKKIPITQAKRIALNILEHAYLINPE